MRAKKLKLKGKAVKKIHHPLSLEVQRGLHFQLDYYQKLLKLKAQESD